jgi:hypothetical protein
VTVKTQSTKNSLVALNIIPSDTGDARREKEAKKLLEKASVCAASTDNILTELIRYDSDITNGITNVVKENKISDIILGLHEQKGITDSFLGKLTEGILSRCNVTTMIYRNKQPLNTVQRYLVIIPENAEQEIGFPFWLLRIWNIGRNTGAKLIFYGTSKSLAYIEEINKNHTIEVELVEFGEWEDFLIISRDLKANDALIIVMSRKNQLSFNPIMKKIPHYLNRYFRSTNYVLIFPMQKGSDRAPLSNFQGARIFNPLLNNMEKFDDMGKALSELFKKK